MESAHSPPDRRLRDIFHTMTAAELTGALAEIGWTDAELARRLGIARVFVGLCRRGMRPVPAWIAQYVSLVRDAVAVIRPDRQAK